MTTNDLFDVISKGVVRVNINQSYLLQNAQQAHRELEGRKTIGSSVLLTGV
jgi:NADPH2:quinone reductase